MAGCKESAFARGAEWLRDQQPSFEVWASDLKKRAEAGKSQRRTPCRNRKQVLRVVGAVLGDTGPRIGA